MYRPLFTTSFVLDDYLAGNRDVLARVHHRLQDQLRASIGVGITHWESRDGAAPVRTGPMS